MAGAVFAAFTAATALLSPVFAVTAQLPTDFGPSHEAARQRAPEIFNAVQNSMRQWGSSVQHNGMSFFLATVPEGVLLHHGNHQEQSPTDPDWLAYEIEHAAGFARGGMPPGRPGGPGRPGRPPPEVGDERPQHIMSRDVASSLDGEEERHGWLHTYKTVRPLQYLYIDGMSGGKTNMGTLDTQDLLLRGLNYTAEDVPTPRVAPGGPMDEQRRAVELCRLCRDWELQGVIRMEAGFEIIQCDFSDGLEQIQALRRPEINDDRGRGRSLLGSLEYVRSLSERYHGIGSTRTTIDYSSTVSAFFFPVNLTNPDVKRQDLPRLVNATSDELAAIKAYLADVIDARRSKPTRTIDWQDVTDIIVSRYADRLEFMADKIESLDVMSGEIGVLLDIYIDYPGGKQEPDYTTALDRCTNFYLGAVTPETEADHLIYTALSTVTSRICSALFEARKIVTGDDKASARKDAVAQAASIMKSLIEYLSWTHYKRCPPCGLDEVCLIPMWPMGNVEDYYSPSCFNGSRAHDGEGYWGGRRPGGPRPPAIGI